MKNSNSTEKMQRCREYIEALEEERRKIQVFQRELPLCLELVSQAIDASRKQLSGTTTEYFVGQSECTSSDGPVLEEFMPIKKTPSPEDEQQSHKPKNNSSKNNDKLSKKSDWLRSVQLWNQTPDEPIKEDSSPGKVSVMEVKRDGSGAFHPFTREKNVGKTPTLMGSTSPPSAVSAAAASSTGEDGGCGGDRSKKEEKEGSRKTRRNWSPDLHRRFLHILEELGGCHVATPKQIRELMKVDGLTNDEVKSHLQKYRLHTRRPNHSIHNNSQAPQLVVVGGIWVPTPEYATSGVSTPNGIYTPIAAPPPLPRPQSSASQTQRQHHKQSKQLHPDESGSHSDGGVHSNSPATSSSTHTTTASPRHFSFTC
ncbi:hypothetical protein F0562_032770 [Nyssa sinensis]|uniref:HTH myb-type domain-containing protein n=1 Tax=Nyssa sinensis TaxID=561372 RepID=A0A5J5ATM0_9ASTE|nr:hypothetical protein F0562_032770 [Nyssa sinensis]